VATGSKDGEIRLWTPSGPADGGGGPVLATGLGGEIRGLAFDEGGTRLAAIDNTGRLRVWRPGSGAQPVERIHADGKILKAVLFLGDAVVTGNDSAIKVWAVDENRSADEPPLAVQEVGSPVAALAGFIMPAGENRQFVVLGENGTGMSVEWRPQERALRVLEPFGVPLGGDVAASMAVSRDRGRLAIGTGNGPIVLLAFAGGNGGPGFTTLRGHIDRVTGLSFSPDGSMLASASVDGSLRLWDVATASPLGAPLRSTGLSVNSVQFSEDGRWLAATSDDGSLIVYEASPVGWARVACGLFRRKVTGDDLLNFQIRLRPEEICAEP
jgi:WD40 repeat protein